MTIQPFVCPSFGFHSIIEVLL